MSSNKRMSWQNLSSHQRRETYQYLKGCLAGASWYYSQLYFVPDEHIKIAKDRLIIRNLHRAFRYLILNEIIHGTRLGSYERQQRKDRRRKQIVEMAVKIAADTGVSFHKVYPELNRRMNPYLG